MLWPSAQARTVLLLLVIAGSFWFASRLSAPRIPYTDFRRAVAEGRVESVTLSDSQVEGRLRDGEGTRPFSALRVEDPQLLPALLEQGVRVDGRLTLGGWQLALFWLLPLGAFVLLAWSRRGTEGQPGTLLGAGRSRARVYQEEEIHVGFADVAGVDEAKAELQEVIAFLQTPERFERLGGKLPRGILLVGPPGTGKTLLARAVAGEAGVPFFSISGSEFVELFVGVGAARMRDLFVQARARAPCIIFIDELDALGKVRGMGPGSHEEREQTLNQLLVELDGFDPGAGVILMAATNRPEILDPALLRAGRFDRHVLVDRPDKAGRLAILTLHAKRVKLAPEVALAPIAAMTAGMVGADMANIVNEAALLAVRRGREAVGKAELEEAVERVVAGLEKRNRVLTAAERERVAYHEVGHALVALAVPGADEVKKISIIPRGVSAVGYTLQVPTEDRFLLTRAELEDRIAVLLGGRAAEQLVFAEHSTGVHDDLRKATRIARSMVREYGMGEALGPVSVAPERPLFLEVREEPRGESSERVLGAIDAEIRELIESQEARALQLLAARRPALHEAALRLLSQEVLTGEELRAIVQGHGLAPAVSLSSGH